MREGEFYLMVLVTNCTPNAGLSVIDALAEKGCEAIGMGFQKHEELGAVLSAVHCQQPSRQLRYPGHQRYRSSG